MSEKPIAVECGCECIDRIVHADACLYPEALRTIQELQARVDRYENEIAAVCPEDQTLTETFGAIRRERDEAQAKAAKYDALLRETLPHIFSCELENRIRKALGEPATEGEASRSDPS